MAKRRTRSKTDSDDRQPMSPIPPGATSKAMNRELNEGGGPPGTGAGPRHAADDAFSEAEMTGRLEQNRTPASPPLDEEDALERGPPFASRSGSAIGGTPAQHRSSEGETRRFDPDSAQVESSGGPRSGHFEKSRIPSTPSHPMRLTGYSAIEYAEKQGLRLNKHPDSISGPRLGLTIAEAEAIAEDDADLIWLDVTEEDYYDGPPTSFEPDR